MTLTFSTCSHCASGISSNGPFSRVAKIDALLISTSTRPHFSMTVSTIAVDGRLVGHVDLDGQTDPAGVLDLLDDGLGLVDVEVGHHGDGSGRGELAGEFAADALGGAGDDDHPVLRR